jgi:hypothetical protein
VNDNRPPHPALWLKTTATVFMVSSLVTVSVIGELAMFIVTSPKSIAAMSTASAALASRADHPSSPKPMTPMTTTNRNARDGPDMETPGRDGRVQPRPCDNFGI